MTGLVFLLGMWLGGACVLLLILLAGNTSREEAEKLLGLGPHMIFLFVFGWPFAFAVYFLRSRRW